MDGCFSHSRMRRRGWNPSIHMRNRNVAFAGGVSGTAITDFHDRGSHHFRPARITGPQVAVIRLFDSSAPDVDLIVNGLMPQFAQFNPTGIPLVFFSNATGVGFLQGKIVSPVPLPAALPLFGSGVLALAGFAWKKRGKVSVSV